MRGLAVSLDGPPPGETDPLAAGARAVYGAALNVACAGGEPIGLTDCLNFGNPEKAAIGWELAQAIEGIAAAAEELGIPVVSGNVSLYNETDGRAIPPTPVVGCVGLVRDIQRIPSRWRRGDRVALLRGEGAGLVRFVWQNAHRFSLAHDVSGRHGEGDPRGGRLVGNRRRSGRRRGSRSARRVRRRGPRLAGPRGARDTSDVRRVRHPRARPRRRPARRTSACWRSSTAARSRPGSRSRRRGG